MFARASRPYTCVSCSLTQQTPTRLRKHARYASKALLTKQKQAIPPPADGQLPPWEEWKDRFHYTGINKTPTLHSLPTARKLVEAFGISKATKPKVILEAFAGPGALSRALCELPPSKMSKLIILEDNILYLPYLEALAKIDKRVVVRPYNAWFWESYTKITEEGLLSDIEIEEWDNSKKHAVAPHSKLHFVATTLPWGESGETLFNQMFRAVATRDWLFKYGPMPFSAVMPYSFWKRAAAKTDEPKLRCKLSVMVAATTVANQALDLKALSTHAVHFFPPQNRPKDYMVAANFYPLGYQITRAASVEAWDYVLRALFINKSTPVSQTFKQVAPGAQNMIKYMDPAKLDLLEKYPSQLTVPEWAVIMDAFHSWPFHPEGDALNDSIKTTDKRI